MQGGKCGRLILETIAKKTGGYYYPCYNAIEAKKSMKKREKTLITSRFLAILKFRKIR